MARRWKDHFELPDKSFVGYSLKQRGKVYVLRFETKDGSYTRVSTGAVTLEKAFVALAQLVLKAYGFGLQGPKPLSWEDVQDRLKTALSRNGNRTKTLDDYLSLIRVLRSTVTTEGPGDVDQRKAHAFADAFRGGSFKRGKAADAKSYGRSHNSLNSYLKKLRSLWNKWLVKKFEAVTSNPWQAVEEAETDDKVPHVPSEDTVTDFLKWVRAKYPSWDLPYIFLQTKAVMGCRLADLCSLRSNQLEEGYLTIDPDQAKARNYRKVKLPAELAKALDKLKGETFLWERYSDDLKKVLWSRKKAAARVEDCFQPSALYWFVQSLFAEYNAGHKTKIHSHDFRRRAITLAFDEGHDPYAVSRKFGLDYLTAIHYYDGWKGRKTDSQFDSLSPKLLPTV